MTGMKKLLFGLLPVLLIAVFLFLLVRDGFWESYAEKSDSTTAVTTLGAVTTSLAATKETKEEVTTAYAPPLLTVGTAAAPEETTDVTEPLEAKEESVSVMAPVVGAPTVGFEEGSYVTEFEDAYVVEIPEDTESEESAPVTGFADTLPLELPIADPVSDDEMRGVYVASVYNLDFPSKAGLSASALAAELDGIVENAASLGYNTVFFQVRPASDALYRSSIFPTSRFLTGKDGGVMTLDPLAYLVEAAHKEGIAVHAWINPFRVTLAGESFASLSAENPARKDPSLTLTVAGQVYYNPALDAVHQLITDGVLELVARYDIDGVLFDDYFYPSDIGNLDSADYAAYRSRGGGLSLADFRRDNVNRLVERVYRAVKILREDCLFGIAPRGIWRNIADDPRGSDTCGGAAYDEIYCDALAWVMGGYVDYLSPQIYWSFDNAAAPFGVLASWWNEALRGSGVKLSVSLAVYYLPKEEIAAQKECLSSLSEYGGYAMYRWGNVK